MARSSQIVGEAFERWICATSTLPVWFKIPSRRNARGQVLKGSVWLDFAGSTESGAFVTGDAKVTSTPSRVSASILEPSQRVHADAALTAQAIVAVIVGWPMGDTWEVAVIPWSVLRAGGVDATRWVAADWCEALRRMHGTTTE